MAVNLGYTPIKEGIPAPVGLLPIQNINVIDIDLHELCKNKATDKAKFTSYLK